MRKFLITLAVVCFTLAGLTNFVSAKEPELTDFKPTEQTYPVEPDEKAELIKQQYGFYVYKLVSDNGECRGIALANDKTGYYQRLSDIGCEPNVDYVSFGQSELPGYITISFYTKTIVVGKMTIKSLE